MRDYRDAKTMAKGLRRSLGDMGTELTHSQSLELISQAFGFDNWNILAAKIEAARPAPAADKQPAGGTLYCSFCTKSQHDVQVLIAGPNTFICNECVELCDNIVEDNAVERLLKHPLPDTDSAAAIEAHLAQYSSEQLATYLARAEERLVKQQQALDGIDAGNEDMPAWLRDRPAAERAGVRTRMAAEIAGRRKSVEIVKRALAARS